MKAIEFIQKFTEESFPRMNGPWIGFDDHDPPFTLTQLRKMYAMGVIELDIASRRYRLSLKATAIRESL